MKKLYFAFAILLVSSIVSLAQTAAVPASKIVIIDTAAFFHEKTGITKIIAAGKQVSDGLATPRNDLVTLVNRAKAIEKEIEVFQENASKNIPVDKKTVDAKVAELERLRREGKFKEEDFNALVQKRQNEIVGPQYSAALQALEGYIRSKGYGLVFDVSKDQNGLLVFATDQYNITKDFITFYNTRPAAATAAVPPKP